VIFTIKNQISSTDIFFDAAINTKIMFKTLAAPLPLLSYVLCASLRSAIFIYFLFFNVRQHQDFAQPINISTPL
jgi:hypothetical protein